MKYIQRVQKGFTLIELMVVIAVVAILVALAVPAYQDYTIRAKVGECINNADVAKLSISEYRETSGIYPADAGQAGIGSGTTVTAGLSEFCNVFVYTGGNTFGISINTAAVDSNISGLIQPLMTATKNAISNNIDWNCSFGSTAAANVKYLPATCRGT